MTVPLFIVSSGRSGTAMMDRLLSADARIDMHHEYMVHHVQQVACRFAMELCGAGEVARVLRQTHGAAIHYCDRPIWGDSSNKLSWIVPVLAEIFPAARFVHLVRDGRKVAGSYLNKLSAECYEDVAVQRLTRHASAPDDVPAPPPEKRYWWPLPRRDDPHAADFTNFDQFQRIVWHWTAVNDAILKGLEAVSSEKKIFVRLEDLASDPDETGRLLGFVGLEPSASAFAALQRPHNVNRPEDRLLTEEQTRQFGRIAWPMMERLGYSSRPEYAMRYG